MDIDDICKVLGGCDPGRAPGIIAEMVERMREYPVSEALPSNPVVLARPEDVYFYTLVIFKTGRWYFYDGETGQAAGEIVHDPVAFWRELPSVPKETK